VAHGQPLVALLTLTLTLTLTLGGTDSPAVAHGQPLVALVEDGVPEVVVAPVVLALRITQHLNVLLVLPRHPSQRRDAVVDLLTNTRTRQVSKRCLAPHV